MIGPERVIIGFVIGFALLFLSWFSPQSKSWVREWAFPIVGLVSAIICYGAGIALAIILGNHIIQHFGGGLVISIAVRSIGIIAAAWGVSLGSQFIENLVRKMRGQKPKKIEWVKGSMRKR